MSVEPPQKQVVHRLSYRGRTVSETNGESSQLQVDTRLRNRRLNRVIARQFKPRIATQFEGKTLGKSLVSADRCETSRNNMVLVAPHSAAL